MKEPFAPMIFLRCFLFACCFNLCLQECAFAKEITSPGDSGSQQKVSPLILAHYMPWYTAKPFSDHWGWHWTMNHFDPEKRIDGKRQIASKYQPLIGPYDSGDPHVLEYHLLTMKLADIDGVIVDWYGLTNFRDYAILHRNATRLLEHCERLKMKFVICYEDQTIPALVEAKRVVADERVAHAVSEINWLSKYWFKSGSYVKHDGKPVLLSFGHSGLTTDEWTQCLSRVESPVAYFSQGMRREGAVGGFDWPAPLVGMAHSDRFLRDSANWPARIPIAFPRFDDIYQEARVGDGYPKLSDDSGQTFQETLRKSLDANPPIIQIATWNDWGEGTQIEPSLEFGFRDLEYIQSLDDNVTQPSNSDSLRLPLKLLELRRAMSDKQDQQALNEISELLIDGATDDARIRMEQLR